MLGGRRCRNRVQGSQAHHHDHARIRRSRLWQELVEGDGGEAIPAWRGGLGRGGGRGAQSRRRGGSSSGSRNSLSGCGLGWPCGTDFGGEESHKGAPSLDAGTRGDRLLW